MADYNLKSDRREDKRQAKLSKMPKDGKSSLYTIQKILIKKAKQARKDNY